MMTESLDTDMLDDTAGPLLPVKRVQQDAEMDITPMIDMTFQLLIFFIVCSKMDASAAPPLPIAKYGGAVPAKNSVIVTVGIDGDGNGVYYKGNGMVPENIVDAKTPADQELELTAYMQEITASASPPKDVLLIKAAKGLKRKDIARIETAASKVEAIKQIFLAVEEGELPK